MGAIDFILRFFGLARRAQVAALKAEIGYWCERVKLSESKYGELIRKIEAKAYTNSSPPPKQKPMTGAQLRRLNEQENARFLEDRGEPSNSEILKEQTHG